MMPGHSSSRRFGKFALPPLVAVAGYSYSVFAEEETKFALSPKEFRKFRLSEVKQLSPNTKMYRYQFPNANDSLGLPVARCVRSLLHLDLITFCSCLVVKAAIDGKDIVRPYTPVSKNSERGHVDLVIKTYPAPYGKMSRHVEAMKVGDELEFKGPFQKFGGLHQLMEAVVHLTSLLDYKPNTKKSVSMIAGGSGITPMLQVSFMWLCTKL
jgi:cytochrome-b5 reductase